MQSFDATLAHLREQFVAGAHQRLRRIGDELRRLSDDAGDAEARLRLSQHLHRLAGAAGTYGYPDIARTAADLAQESERGAINEARLKAWRSALADVREAFGLARSGVTRPVSQARVSSGGTALVLMTWGDERERMRRALEAQGMRVRTASDRATARRALRQDVPAAMVIDLAVQGGTGAQVVPTLREQAGGERSVVVFIARDADFAGRMEAMEAGADLIVEGEFEAERVAARLQEQLERRSGERGRVLLVEGDPDQAAYVERLLRASGYEVAVCIEATHVGETVDSFQPDVVLLESLRGGSGPVDSGGGGGGGELIARALRQDRRHRALPLLFLTSGQPSEAELRVADGLLRKPVEPRVLLTLVQTHVERARLRAELGELDPLTNLLHHGAFVRRLSQWMTEGDPGKVGCALVLADVDATSELNARFGHSLADNLVHSLAQTAADTVPGVRLSGRYDGDAVALLVVGQSAEALREALEALRERFAGAERYAPDGRLYQANFTAGVARYQQGWRQPRVWLAAAEDALRAAKREGGGRVSEASASARPALNVPRR